MKMFRKNNFFIFAITAFFALTPFFIGIVFTNTAYAATPTVESVSETRSTGEAAEDAGRKQGEGDANGGFSVRQCGEDIGKCFTRGIIEVGILTMQFSLFILSVVGVFLDVSLLLSFNMGALINPGTTLGKVVAEMWSIFRDIVNLIFIAGIVWVSIAMILQINMPGGGSNGRFIANIIIAAILVNFSFFFTGLMIDASNRLAQEIYEEGVLSGQNISVGDATTNFANDRVANIADIINFVIRASGGLQASGGQAVVGFDTIENTAENTYLSFIGGLFLHETKLVSILDPESLRIVANTGSNAGLALVVFSGVMLVGATIELFVAMFFAIIGRFLILLFLLILSPLIVFPLMGVQTLSSWGQQWWKSLMSQLVFLPVFVFLVAVSFRVVGGFTETFKSNTISLIDLFGSPTRVEFESAFALIIVFFIAYGMLKYSNSISQNIAQGKQVPLPSVEQVQGVLANAGNRAGQIAKGVGTLPRALTLGSVGWAGSELARRTGVQSGFAGLWDGVGDAWRGRSFLGGDPLTVQREKRAREAAKKEASDAINDRNEWEKRRDKARLDGDMDAVADANDKIDKLDTRIGRIFNDMYDTLGPKKMARYLAQHRDQIDPALDALEDEKAAELAAQLNSMGIKPAESSGGSGGGSGQEDSREVTERLDTLIAQSERLSDEEKREHIREKRRDEAGMRELAAAVSSKENIERFKGAYGPGALGELPTELITKAVIEEMDSDDLAVLAGRKDEIDNEEYRRIKVEIETNIERTVTQEHESSPSSVADD